MHPTAIATLLLLACLPLQAAAQDKASDSSTRTIEAVLTHPVLEGLYTCGEHAAGELEYLGDDLGQDCMLLEFASDPMGTEGFPVMFQGDGKKNADWYGWNKPVLSPAAGKIVAVKENPVVNTPGTTGTPPASVILLKTDEEVFYVIAHIQAPKVAAGDTVAAGQVIASVGNNGFGRFPHIHIGAWKGKDALQIRWDQQKMTPVK